MLRYRRRERRIKSAEENLVKIVRMVTCRSSVVKIKEHLSICREFSTLCIEDRACLILKEERLLESQVDNRFKYRLILNLTDLAWHMFSYI